MLLQPCLWPCTLFRSSLKEEEGCGCLAVQSLKSETAGLPQLALCGHDGPELGRYFHRFRNVALSLSLDLMYQ